MTCAAVQHRLYDLLGTRVPYVVVDELLSTAWEYRPVRRLLTLGATDRDSVLDAAALVYLASSADLGQGPCRVVPTSPRDRYLQIRRRLAHRVPADTDRATR